MEMLCHTISSECGHYRVEIFHRTEGVFRVESLKLIEERVPGCGRETAFWIPMNRAPMFTDTLVTAERLARETIDGLTSDPPV
jgi:hypothetical protein